MGWDPRAVAAHASRRGEEEGEGGEGEKKKGGGRKGGREGGFAGQINGKANKSATLTCRSPPLSVYFIR